MEQKKRNPSARILIIEDDLATALIMEDSLREDRHKVFTADTGKLALEKVHSWKPQIIICDLNLPDISGIEILKKIRSLKEFPFIPSIIATTDTTPETIVNCLHYSEEYLIKPVEPNELRARVRSMFRLKLLNDKIERLNESLEKRIGKKTSELIRTNSKLKKEVNKRRKSEMEVRMLSDVLKSVQESERSRFARDIHDAIGTSLLTLKLMIQSDSVNRTQENDDVSESVRLIDLITESVRNVAHSLYPASLKKIGLSKSVREWIAGLNDTHRDLKIRFESEWDEKSIPDNWNIEVYRILQEAVTNAIKHSFAKKISVELGPVSKSNALLKVTDNGRGFSSEKGHGIGLLIMKERSLLIGCSLKINSKISKGTEVTLECKKKPEKY